MKGAVGSWFSWNKTECVCECRRLWNDGVEAATDGNWGSDVTHSAGNGSRSAEGRSCDGRHWSADGH